jgi:uncharacterized protein (TIGR02217 family)
MTAWGALFPLNTGLKELTSGIRYQTDITVGKSGYESRNANWQDPLLVFNAALGIKTYADIDTLKTFFHGVRGREQSFLIKDYQDYSFGRITIATGDGADTTYQLIKKYTHAVLGTYSRNITKPESSIGNVRVWVNSVEKTNPAQFTYSSTTGIITFAVAPPNGHAIEASCAEFYVPVRFDVDELPVDMLMFYLDASLNKVGHIEVPDIPLIEVRNE